MVVVLTLEGSILNTPKPRQYVGCEYSDPAPGCNAGQSLLGAGFAVSELISTDDDCNQTCDFRYRSGEQGLHCSEARVKGRPAGLSVQGSRHEQEKQKGSIRAW